MIVIKYYINGVVVKKVGECVQYYDEDGKFVIELFKDYIKKIFIKFFVFFDDFIKCWNSVECK